MLHSQLWLIVGLLGQAFFSCRFIVQWIASEKQKQSIIPVAFWWFSITGGLTLFCYALWREDPVFILGQSIGIIIYTRNLVLIYRNRAAQKHDGEVQA